METAGIFPPMYFAPVAYYAAMAKCDRIYIDLDIRHDRRFKAAHRCDIISNHGPVQLTVPVCKLPAGAAPTWRNILVSDHDRWWEQHVSTLATAYGRTPFFEFYIDRFLPLMSQQAVGRSVADICREADTMVRRILGITAPASYSALHAPTDAIDYRRSPLPPHAAPYYQVRAHQMGFHPGLSILDLIFNTGTESPLYIR